MLIAAEYCMQCNRIWIGTTEEHICDCGNGLYPAEINESDNRVDIVITPQKPVEHINITIHITE